MIEDNLKTLIDTQWSGAVNGITKTCYVYIKNDPDLSEEASPATNAVIIVIYPSGGVATTYGYGSDIFTFDGRMKIEAVSVANIVQAIANLKAVAETIRDLYFINPPVMGDVRENFYFTFMDFTWKKVVARS